MKDRIDFLVSPQLRFYTAAIVIPAFLLIDSLLVKGFMTVFLAGLVIVSGKTIRFLFLILMISTITFFQLLTPRGEVLLVLGPLIIAEESLYAGLLKSFTLLGLIYLSLSSIRKGIRFPGFWGTLFTGMFYYFGLLMEEKSKLRRNDFIKSLDELLTGIYDPDKPNIVIDEDMSFTPSNSYFYPSLMIIIFWGGFLVDLLLL